MPNGSRMSNSNQHVRERQRLDFSKIQSSIQIPNLIEVQMKSYQRFLQMDLLPSERDDGGLQSVFTSVFPIRDFREMSQLEFVDYSIGNWECKCGNLKGLHHLRATCRNCGASVVTNPYQTGDVLCTKCGTFNKNTPTFCEKCGDPVGMQLKYDVNECQERGMTYAAPLKVTIRLTIYDKDPDTGAKNIRDIKEQEVFFGDIPLMTDNGTFTINGTERVIVSQLHRSPGVFYESANNRTYFLGKIIPYRGSWVEFEYDTKNILYVRIDRKRKFLGSIFLRALGMKSNEEILRTFYQVERVTLRDSELHWNLSEGLIDRKLSHEIKNPKTDDVLVGAHKRVTEALYKELVKAKVPAAHVSVADLEGAFTVADLVNRQTGEVLLEANKPLTAEIWSALGEAEITSVDVFFPDRDDVGMVLSRTLDKDAIKSPREALIEIYRKLRPGDPPTLETATSLFNGMFFDPRKYDFSRVGRLKFNIKFGLETSLNTRTLDAADFVASIRYLLKLRKNIGTVDDIDHLGNRRVRAVGELLENQFRIGLVRMERAIKEKMSVYQEMSTAMPHDLVNAKPVMAAIREFFGSSQLSQFMDQTNPLSEITHKRRLSALGPGGLSRERAGFEVRDVHPTHYGRICPIETPEGPNIGLISSLACYARINEFGFIEAPYRKVVQGTVTDEIVRLTALEEEQFVIAQANAELDRHNRFAADRVSARKSGEFRMVVPNEVHFMDVSPKQLVSVAASMVPFLENDDANRALMGSNMQRQAVPLLQPEAPLVGTGLEGKVARDSHAVVLATDGGKVASVTADQIVVRAGSRSKKTDPGQDLPLDIYNLTKYRRSNQNTCINQRPIVGKGDRVKAGDVIGDGPATDQGELALGRNVLVAFMPWGGYNFEDAILVSERLVKDDRYTSIHIAEFEVQARDTKLGKEEVTRDIPNVSEEALKDLDDSGIVRIGAKVKAGDILVGKITPKGETQLTPEEKLLRAIFGEKAGDVRDTSLTVPPGIEGTVVDVKVFSRRGVDKDERAKSIEEEEIARLEKDYQDEIAMVEMERDQKLKNLLVGKTSLNELFDPTNKAERVTKKGDHIDRPDLDNFSWNELKKVKVKEDEGLAQMVRRIEELAEEQIGIYDSMLEDRIGRLRRGDDLPPGVIKMVKVYVAVKRKLSVGDKMAGRHGNKGVVSKILPEEDMPYLPDGTPVEIVLNPLGVPSRMNVGQILETHLGWAARALGAWVFFFVCYGDHGEEIKEHLKQAGLPSSGKTVLYDGRTGKPFHQEVTVGQIYILKLAHLVDDKMHARSIGPYSLVTQQPLGGKAQFGGQRFGEMEVWALEAYGAAHTLQEMLTVKSDDVEGRNRIYEAIVKGENFLEPGTPESFNVLVKELQSLALDVELVTKDGKKAS